MSFGFEDIMPFIPTAIGWGLGGPMGGAMGSMVGAGMANGIAAKRNAEAAQKQMDFQREMSNTAHQREIMDLQAAGLNPTLSAGGNGASTPSGAMANAQAPPIDFPMLVQAKALDFEDRKIKVMEDDQNLKAWMAGPKMSKDMTDAELNKMKKTLMQKGLIRAEAEGAGLSIIKEYIDQWKRRRQQSPNQKWDWNAVPPLDPLP